MKYEVRRNPAAPNLWEVWDTELGIGVYGNIYKAECDAKAQEYNSDIRRFKQRAKVVKGLARALKQINVYAAQCSPNEAKMYGALFDDITKAIGRTNIDVANEIFKNL